VPASARSVRSSTGAAAPLALSEFHRYCVAASLAMTTEPVDSAGEDWAPRGAGRPSPEKGKFRPFLRMSLVHIWYVFVSHMLHSDNVNGTL
jgi:hypothetical protein